MLAIIGKPGNAKTFERIARIPADMARGLKRGSLSAGKSVQKEIRRRMEAPKHGNIYILRDIWTGRPLRHRASAPGEAPARFSGSLKASVNYIGRSDQLIIGAGTSGNDAGLVHDAGYPSIVDLGGQIGFGRVVDYAEELETIKNRPYLRVSVMDQQRNILTYLFEAGARELRAMHTMSRRMRFR
jgi:hypothetical protein